MEETARQALAEKLDNDFETFLKEKLDESAEQRKNEPESREQTLDEIVEELKNHPAFMTEFDPSKPMSAAMEGLQQLKYESDSNDDNATSYKEDGNKNFELKKYRWAIDNYTAGIKCKPVCRQLNAVLYCNRAAANFHIGNFLSSYNDCVIARKFKPDHLKAIVRGATCCVELKRYTDALSWCDVALQISPQDSTVVKLRAKADKLQRQLERDRRKEVLKEKKESEKESQLVQVIQERGIKLAGINAHNHDVTMATSLLLSSLETHHPSGAMVTLDNDGTLHWPVLFLYPEFTQTDFVTSFSEQTRFVEQLHVMFGDGCEPPAWDRDRRYTVNSIQVYFEVRDTETLHDVKKSSTLLSVLQHRRYVVHAGTPNFIIVVKDSPFSKQFLSKYKILD